MTPREPRPINSSLVSVAKRLDALEDHARETRRIALNANHVAGEAVDTAALAIGLSCFAAVAFLAVAVGIRRIIAHLNAE